MTAGVAARLEIFRDLESYSRAEIELLNWFHQAFSTTGSWKSWMREGLGALLEVPGPAVLSLHQTNQAEASPVREYRFEGDQIRIGREADNDIVLALPGIGRRHARIFKQDNQFFIEDLGSANGTHLNDRKLLRDEPAPLNDGELFLIFPYLFTVGIQRSWSSESNLQIAGPAVRFTTWRTHDSSARGFHRFSIQVHPTRERAAFAVSRSFLDEAIHRLTRDQSTRLPSDRALLELALLSVLERANQNLYFPFQFSLAGFEEPVGSESGISLEFSLGLTGKTGVIRLFLPGDLLDRLRATKEFGARSSHALCSDVPFSVLASRGYVDLTLAEFGELEQDDILIFQPEIVLLLPPETAGAERGWQAVQCEEAPAQLRVETYFERTLFMDSEGDYGSGSERITKPDLTALPVRVHVILAQLELSLAELGGLASGSIIELDRNQTEPVQLAVNGKIAGAGTLVEVEGKLGVRITDWKGK